MTDIKRPLSLKVNRLASSSSSSSISSMSTRNTTRHQRVKSWQARSSQASCSTASTSSSNSSLSSSSSMGSNCATPETPSLILPYLYVGDQDQTQIDTISSLNISYILSLQSLPKFLDSDGDDSTKRSDSREMNLERIIKVSGNQKVRNGQPVDDLTQAIITKHQEQQCISSVSKSEHVTTSRDELKNDAHDYNLCQHDHDKEKQIDPKKLLPSMNSSKDYLVKFRSCVHRLIRGKCINISDTFEQLIDKFFDETHGFIEEARRNRCNILVHCKAGISRSPTVAIAYLMKWKRLHLQDAYDFVKRCRPQISPNLNFMGQLMNYERRLLQKESNSHSLLPSPSLCYLPNPRLSQEDLNNSDNEDTRYNQPGTIHIAA